jgi:enoyl-CoA hydratase/carnithine racemase
VTANAGPGVAVRLEDHGASGLVAHVTLANPGKLNIVNRALMGELLAASERLAATAGLRAVVLTGDGAAAFIGGADIGEMAELDAATARDFITLLHRVCDGLRRLPVPVIARIDGYALGAGLEIAASCDLRIASERAIFGMPEVRVGIPSVIEAALLPALIGWGRTRHLLLTGESISAAEAARWGLVERVVPPAELDGAVATMLDAILACGSNALRLQKELIRYWEDHTMAEAVEQGITSFTAAWDSDEPQRLMQRFLDAKRRNRGGATPS